VVQAGRDALGGTGFSREGVRCLAAKSMVNAPASSRLKPVLLNTACTQWNAVSQEIASWYRLDAMHLVGPALAGKASDVSLQINGERTGLFPAEAGPTKSMRTAAK
jgi:hypothetical protein